MPPKVSLAVARRAPQLAVFVWVFWVYTVTQTGGPPDGQLLAGRSLVWTVLLGGSFPVTVFYQAAFILRYPGLAARDDVQTVVFPGRSTTYEDDEARWFGVKTVGLALFLLCCTAFVAAAG